jgi:acetylornithine deacetylase/succinyl-diaminopimelate desuccinylase-like protein
LNSLENVESARNEILEILRDLGLENDAKLIINGSGECYILPEGIKNEKYYNIKKIVDNFSINGNLFMNGYTEADIYFREYGIPTINLGPGNIGQAHKSDEYVDISNVIDAVKIYYKILEQFIL